ncbi:MAG: histidine ammonia-lyase [bacterium]|nr:histidine ammonia-lyase [bacterium]
MARSPRTPRGQVKIDGSTMTLAHVEAIADGGSCGLTPGARRRVRESRAVVDRAVASGEQVYGINTGFGHLADVPIENDRLDQLQLNLVRSHAAGVGDPLGSREVRAVLALRANCLCRGHSGLRIETVQRLIELLQHDILPVVPEQGSVGACGDLAPLAHIALALIGEGDVYQGGKRASASRALKRAGLAPLRLGPKEGLALINGTQVMSAIGILALLAAERLALLADVIGAMTLEALKGSHKPFAAAVQAARPQPGQRAAAANVRRILRGSEVVRSHATCGRVQDAYALRCMPQVHGAVRDALRYVRGVLEVEVNSSTDNPMIFPESDSLISAGNFHGHPVSVALDHLGTAVCSLATISERRIDRLVNPSVSGLPAFLAHDPGLHSGFMMAHVTAAALVSENKILAHPASVDSIPTSAGKEDHVSMGTHAARKAASIVRHVTTVLAVELLCAGQALDLLRPLRAGRGVEAARRELRRHVPHLDGDRRLAPDIDAAAEVIRGGGLRRAVERATGSLR